MHENIIISRYIMQVYVTNLLHIYVDPIMMWEFLDYFDGAKRVTYFFRRRSRVLNSSKRDCFWLSLSISALFICFSNSFSRYLTSSSVKDLAVTASSAIFNLFDCNCRQHAETFSTSPDLSFQHTYVRDRKPRVLAEDCSCIHVIRGCIYL